MGDEDKGRTAFLDLLINVLAQHEKSLDQLTERLETLLHEIKGKGKEGREGKAEVEPKPEPEPETITFIKIEVKRPIEEIIKILETLKG
jgi:hypothetical protein